LDSITYTPNTPITLGRCGQWYAADCANCCRAALCNLPPSRYSCTLILHCHQLPANNFTDIMRIKGAFLQLKFSAHNKFTRPKT